MPTTTPHTPRFRSDKSRDAKFHTRTHGILTLRLVAWLRTRDRAAEQVFFTTRFESGEEDSFQIELIDTLYAVMAPDFECTHIPGGSARVTMGVAAYLKRMGTKAGLYDLWCGWDGGEHWLELKAGSAKPSFAQVQFGQWLKRTGKGGRVVRTICEALWCLLERGAPIDPRFHPLAMLGRSDREGDGS
jgi:hypothetical protein